MVGSPEMAEEPDRSHLPSAVRDAGRRADELIRQQQAPPVDPNAPGDTVPPGSAPPAGSDGGTPETPPAASPPTAPIVPPVAGDPPPVTPPGSAGGDWEQKYRTLQGKYDTELDQARQRLLDMERQLEQRRASTPSPPSPPPPPTAAREKVQLTEDELEATGPQLVDIIRKAARAELQGDLEELDRLRNQAAQIDTKFQETAEIQEEAEYKRFLDRLDANPGGIKWREVQKEPEFVEFITQADRYTGRTRQSLLTDAANSLDTGRVLAFYEDYLATRTGSRPGPADRGQQPPVRLETQLSPSAGAGSSPAAASRPTGRIWSRADISRFYTDRQKGVFRGPRAQEGSDLERDLFDAEREGRIRL